MLGHASAAMTLDVYAGLFEDSLDGVADRMDAMARGAADFCGLAAVSRPFPSLRRCGQRHLTCEDARWGSRDLNPGPTDYESVALTG